MSETALAIPKVKEPPKVENPPRKSRSEKQTLDIVFAQQAEQGIAMKCGCGCGRALTRGNLRCEHETARKLAAPGADPDRVSNQRYWAKDPCSLAKDKRDVAAIAKSKRIRGETKSARREKKKISAREFPAPAGMNQANAFAEKQRGQVPRKRGDKSIKSKGFQNGRGGLYKSSVGKKTVRRAGTAQ